MPYISLYIDEQYLSNNFPEYQVDETTTEISYSNVSNSNGVSTNSLPSFSYSPWQPGVSGGTLNGANDIDLIGLGTLNSHHDAYIYVLRAPDKNGSVGGGEYQSGSFTYANIFSPNIDLFRTKYESYYKEYRFGPYYDGQDSGVQQLKTYFYDGQRAHIDNNLWDIYAPSAVGNSEIYAGIYKYAGGSNGKQPYLISDHPLSPDEVIDYFGLQYTPPGTGTGTGTGTSTPVYRFAKISNGHYFFTANQTEKQYIESSLHDFRYEGVGFYANTSSAATPVYRFANLKNGGYFYTASEPEKSYINQSLSNTFRFEGTSFSANVDGSGNAVYRLANLKNGGYLFTADANEKNYAVSLGIWRDEGVAFRMPSQNKSGSNFHEESVKLHSEFYFAISDADRADDHQVVHILNAQQFDAQQVELTGSASINADLFF